MLQYGINEKYAMIQKKCLFTNVFRTGNMYACYNAQHMGYLHVQFVEAQAIQSDHSY